MADNNLMGNWFIEDLEAGSIAFSSGSLTNTAISSAAAIASSKLVNRIQCVYQQGDGAALANTAGDGVPIYVCDKANGTTIKKVSCLSNDVGSAGDPVNDIAVDVFMFDDSAGTSASVLSADMNIGNSQTDYEIVNGTLSTTAMELGDVLCVKVTVTGSGGTASQGLLVQVEVDEAGS